MRTTAGMRKEEEKKDVRKGACGRSLATTERRIETVARHPLLQLSQRWASCCVAGTDSVHRSNSWRNYYEDDDNDSGNAKDHESKDVRKDARGRSLATIERRIETRLDIPRCNYRSCGRRATRERRARGDRARTVVGDDREEN